MSNLVIPNMFYFDSKHLTLSGPSGQELAFSLNGASMAGLLWPCADGERKQIVLGTSDPSVYAGATLGPVAGRLSGGILPVGDEILQLSLNEGENILHGGTHNLSRQRWTLSDSGDGDDCAWVDFECDLPHGLDGFPGERHFTARYTLTAESITIEYTAQTDRPTLISMSNHTYWNLTGDFSSDSYDQLLELRVDGVLYNDEANLPFALRPCKETAFDFFAPTSLRQAMRRVLPSVQAILDSDAGQISNGLGYNNGFALTPNALFAARLTDSSSRLRMTLTTDQPYLVIYSGGYLPIPGCALALEAQGMPGAVTPLLEPEQTYQRFIRFAFDSI